jgi:uncharacterized protein with FMN-binding domain
MAQSGSNKKVANSLVTASCAAVIAVYVAGYERTEAAAEKFASQVAERRVAPRIEPTVTKGEPGRAAFRVPRGTPLPPPLPALRDTRGRTDPMSAANGKPLPPVAELLAARKAVAPEAAPVEAPAAQIVEAPAPITEPKPDVAPPPLPKWKDGTYTGWGYSRHGDIEASVVIEGGRIASAVISQCRTRYSCSVIERLPPEVAQRQSPDVDYVSGATQSADAFYGAVVEALGKAK